MADKGPKGHSLSLLRMELEWRTAAAAAALVTVCVTVYQISVLSMTVADLQTQLNILKTKSRVSMAVSTPGSFPSNSLGDPNLPMSLQLAENVYYDNGQGGDWTEIESPAPVPPPKVQKVKRKTMYGGSQEADHVGGFLQNDTQSFEPRVWEFMVHVLGVKSVVDIGCGRGISTKWFLDHGCRVKCAEATDEGIATTVLPSRDLIVQHDFTQGPWWPKQQFDAVWSVEFLEHVNEEYMDNWFATMRSAHYIFTTHSKWGGHHHVAIHHDWWWIEKFASRGFEYMPEVTDIVRRMSMTQSNYMKQSGLVFRNTRNVRVKPLLGPGAGNQHCTETRRLLWGTQLLKQACNRGHWDKGANPIIPWNSGCKKLCTEINY